MIATTTEPMTARELDILRKARRASEVLNGQLDDVKRKRDEAVRQVEKWAHHADALTKQLVDARHEIARLRAPTAPNNPRLDAAGWTVDHEHEGAPCWRPPGGGALHTEAEALAALDADPAAP